MFIRYLYYLSPVTQDFHFYSSTFKNNSTNIEEFANKLYWNKKWIGM